MCKEQAFLRQRQSGLSRVGVGSAGLAHWSKLRGLAPTIRPTVVRLGIDDVPAALSAATSASASLMTEIASVFDAFIDVVRQFVRPELVPLPPLRLVDVNLTAKLLPIPRAAWRWGRELVKQ